MPGTIAIAAYRVKVSAILDDPTNAKYTTTLVDVAIRQALSDYSKALPLVTSYIFESDGNQIQTLPADFQAFNLFSLQDASKSPPVEYTFYAYMRGEQWMIETPKMHITAGTALTILYGALNTIDGLDSAAGTTIPDEDADIFSIGAAGYAIVARINSLAENIVQDPLATKILQSQADSLLDRFKAFLERPTAYFRHSTWTLDTDRNY